MISEGCHINPESHLLACALDALELAAASRMVVYVYSEIGSKLMQSLYYCHMANVDKRRDYLYRVMQGDLDLRTCSNSKNATPCAWTPCVAENWRELPAQRKAEMVGR